MKRKTKEKKEERKKDKGKTIFFSVIKEQMERRGYPVMRGPGGIETQHRFGRRQRNMKNIFAVSHEITNSGGPGISHPFHRAAVHFSREKFGLAVLAISRTVYIERRSLEQGNKTVARRFCRWFSRVAAVNSPPHSHSFTLSLSLSLFLSFLVCRATRTLAYFRIRAVV